MPSYFVKVRVTSTDRKAAQAAAVRIARLFSGRSDGRVLTGQSGDFIAWVDLALTEEELVS